MLGDKQKIQTNTSKINDVVNGNFSMKKKYLFQNIKKEIIKKVLHVLKNQSCYSFLGLAEMKLCHCKKLATPSPAKT